MFNPEINNYFREQLEPKNANDFLNSEKSPLVVTCQTYKLLELHRAGLLLNKDTARTYFHDYTIDYLNKAEAGSEALFATKGKTIFINEDLSLEDQETAHHAFIVFAHLPDNMTSQFLPMGFSRKGMLRAPDNRESFLEKITELKLGIWRIVSGEVDTGATLEAYPYLLRTYGFFKVGSKLQIKLEESQLQKKEREKENFNNLLKDVDIDL